MSEQQLLEGDGSHVTAMDGRTTAPTRTCCLVLEMGGLRTITVVNYSDYGPGLVMLPWGDLSSRVWTLSDDHNRQVYEDHDGNALGASGLTSRCRRGVPLMRLEQAGAAGENRREAA